VLKVDNAVSARAQIAKLERLRADATSPPSYHAGRHYPGSGRSVAELLALAIDAARAKAPSRDLVALERAWGRHAGQIRTISGVYRHEDRLVAQRRHGPATWWPPFAAAEGRQPRHPGRQMGQDGTTRPEGDPTAFCRPRLRSSSRPAVPDAGRGARQAVERTVHIVGVNSLAAGHLTLVPRCAPNWPNWAGRTS